MTTFRVAMAYWCFAVSLCLLSQSQSATQESAPSASQPASVETNVKGVNACVPPPSDFDFHKASDAQLAHYAIPPRPDKDKQPEAYKLWETIAESAKGRPTKTKLIQTHLLNAPARQIKMSPPTRSGTPGTGQSVNWSGFVVYDPTNPFTATSNTTVGGSFVVPGLSGPRGCPGNVPMLYSSIWVGIDGWNSNDVLQAGIHYDINCTFGSKSYAWIEWYPNYEIQIPGFQYGWGDVISVTASAATTGYFLNIINMSLPRGTPNPSRCYVMTPPPGTQLVGNSIEWIVERPEINGALSNLADYSLIGWKSLYSYGNGRSYQPSAPATGTAYLLTMQDGNTPISTPCPLYSNGTDWDSAWFRFGASC